MRIGHYLFGLACLVLAGLFIAWQGADSYRTGYRIEALLRDRARLFEARQRLMVAIEAKRRPDRLMERAARMSIPLSEPDSDEDKR